MRRFSSSVCYILCTGVVCGVGFSQTQPPSPLCVSPLGLPPPGTNPTATYVVNPPRIEFGQVLVGSSNTGLFCITSTGTNIFRASSTDPQTFQIEDENQRPTATYTVTTGLYALLTVQFTPLAAKQYNSPISITAGGGSPSIVQLGGTGTSPPTVTNITSSQTGANQTLTVFGSGFEPGLTVTVGLPGGSYSTVSGSAIGNLSGSSFQMVVTLPSAGAYTVQVNNPDGGKSNVAGFNVSAPTPGISTITPANLTAAASSQTLTIFGSGFEAGLTVTLGLPSGGSSTIGGAQIGNVSISSFQMVVTLSVPGTYSLHVNNPDGGKSAVGTFTVSASSPSIAAISPSGLTAAPGGQTLTVSGIAFQAGLTVTLGIPNGSSLTIAGAQVGNVSAASFQVVATLAAPGTYTLQVSNPDGGRSNVANFNVAAAGPTIASIAPANPAIGNQVLTVTGGGFQAGLTVRLGLPGGGFATIGGAQIGSVSPSSFQVAVTLAGPGVYTLQVNNPDGGKSAPFSFGVGTVPDIVDGGVVNGASFQPGIASSSWVTIKGTSLSLTTRQWGQSDFVGNLLPKELDGVSVTIDGLPAYIYYVSPTQLNVLAPDDSAVGPVAVVVKNSLGTSSPASANKAARTPAFFMLSGAGYPAAVHADGTLVGPAGLIPGVPSAPAKPGETIVLFGTGFGDTNPPLPAGQVVAQPADLALPVSVLIGALPANVSYAGRTGSGLDQINVEVPAALPDGDATLVARIGGLQTQGNVLLSVRQSATQANSPAPRR